MVTHENSRGKSDYVTFTDNYSHKIHHTRAECLTHETYEARLKTQKGISIKALQSDRGGEYLTNDFSSHLKQAGTICCLTAHNSPAQNGVAEDFNPMLLEWTCAMLHSSGLPKYLWGECIKHAVWLKNSTSTCALYGCTPYEVILKSKLNLTGSPEWGSLLGVKCTALLNQS